MPYSTVMDLALDSEAKLLKWFAQWDSGNGADIQYPELVVDGVNSHARIVVAQTPVAVAKAFKTKAAMDADLAHAAGTLVNCFAVTTADRGRYQKVGASGTGSWTRVGDIADKLWEDKNHVDRTLELLMCSNTDSTPLPPLVGTERGWVSPPGNDWTNARVTIDMRVKDFYLGKWSKICQHVQGNIQRLTSVLDQVHGLGNFAIPNFILTSDLISDQLGFGNDSWGVPNKVPYVEDSGWVQVVLNYSADDADWDCLGRIERPLSASPFHYVCTSIAELLSDLQGNSYMLAVHDRPTSDSSPWTPASGVIGDENRVRGEMLIRGIKVEVPS